VAGGAGIDREQSGDHECVDLLGCGFAVMTTLWALVQPKVLALYFAFAVLGALLAGYAYELILAVI
jgi:hypothetical protein